MHVATVTDPGGPPAEDPPRRVSVVICAYTLERWAEIGAAVESVRRQTRRPAEVVLVIDHNPELLARAEAAFPDVQAVPNTGTRGLSGARNTGVARASGDVIAFLDDDAAADAHWVERLLAAYSDKRVSGVGGGVVPDWAVRRIRTSIVAVVLGLLTGLGLVAVPTAAAAPGDIGYLGPAYNGSINSPTSDKPQSKLWHTDGIWFAAMFDTGSRTWRISRLDRATQTWVNTGVLVDDRPNTLADTLWDGSHLYIASHVVTISSDTTPRPSVPDSPARLMRYSYDSGQKTFRLDAGFPATITGNSSESMTIDKDSTGRIWATWTQVSGDATAGFTSAVYVNATNGSDNSWGTPFVMPTAGANPAPDDLSAVVAFGRNKIGVLWSNQVDDTVYWAVHNDGAAVGDWRGPRPSAATGRPTTT